MIMNRTYDKRRMTYPAILHSRNEDDQKMDKKLIFQDAEVVSQQAEVLLHAKRKSYNVKLLNKSSKQQIYLCDNVVGWKKAIRKGSVCVIQI